MMHDPDLPGRTDSYKITQWMQLRPGTQFMKTALTSRYCKIPGITHVVAYGAWNYYLQEFFGQRVTRAEVDDLRQLCVPHFGTSGYFNQAGWDHILNDCGGFIPLRIKIAPEGSRVPIGMPLAFVENMTPQSAWCSSYIESLKMKVTYPMTVATISDLGKQTILRHNLDFGSPEGLAFMLQDFGYRGVSSEESAEIGGSAHMVNFMGSDTIRAIKFIRRHYGEPCAGHSVFATEHSTTTSWGKAREFEAYLHFIDTVDRVAGDQAICSIVGDSWDIYNACRNGFGGVLRDRIMSRRGRIVVRPDSGIAVQQLPELLRILTSDACFGRWTTTNSKGFKILPHQIRLLQGDGNDINEHENTINDNYLALKAVGFAADNLCCNGMGGGLLQKVNRDTLGIGDKCCQTTCDGVTEDVTKTPVDQPEKRSRGYSEMREWIEDGLVTAYDRGEIMNTSSWRQVTARAAEFYNPSRPAEITV